MKRTIIFFLSVLAFLQLRAQITTMPEMPVVDQELTITFNSDLDKRLGKFTADLYAHTGVTIEGKGDWQRVIGDWNNNDVQPKLTNKGNGIYELKITPSIASFYNIASGEKVTKLWLVFRSADGSKQTNDLSVSVYQSGLSVSILSPEKGTVLDMGQSYAINATSGEAANLTLKVNGTTIKQTNGTSISGNYVFGASGESVVVALAEANGKTVSDTAKVFVRGQTPIAKLPLGAKKGITYPNSTMARLVMWAPNKKFVFVLGDFNNWKLANEYQMKKDGNYFWIDIEGLVPAQEYAFQYLVDGKIRIADPYAAKVLDPWNDGYITSATYPNLKPYPTGKTDGIASVLQTSQQAHQWESTAFQVPSKEKMVIYELLVRDFTSEHTFSTVIDRLDYLQELRVNVLELMPINEFEGNSSWGYNPSFYFAVDKYYGPASDLKKLVDECHKRGIAVVIDMVLNHSFDQSPFVQLYAENGSVTADNPWYNQQSNFKNPSLTWGYDFNHESTATRELVDSVNSYWLNEFKVDGFRFDFTKGFSNTPYNQTSWGSEYDAARIENLKRMSNEIWKRNPSALVICEHLSDNAEETVLANHGLMLWGNMNYNYAEAAMGYNENGKSDLSGSYYERKGWQQPNLVTYQESHDEERVAYKCKTWGNAVDGYDIKDTPVGMNRIEMNALFHLLLPGPKMIWQFGELGYDFSIEQNGRTGEKPIHWDYLNEPARTGLYKTMASLNYLKQNYDEFSGKLAAYSLTTAVKSFTFSNGTHHVVALGNFDVVERTTKVKFPVTGTWYNYFEKKSIAVSSLEVELTLAPGEYLLLSTREFQHPTIKTEAEMGKKLRQSVMLYPNPAADCLYIFDSGASTAEVYSIKGEKLISKNFNSSTQTNELNISGLKPGIYFLKLHSKKQVEVERFIKK